ncbi:MAG TPA: phytoene/squalene synthase family protein [Acidisarcina sp.]
MSTRVEKREGAVAPREMGQPAERSTMTSAGGRWPETKIAAAYRACEEIARREARNFYYAFRALPKAKRNAICAVYAFMRHADDLSDDETISHTERRAALDGWLAEWHRFDEAFERAALGDRFSSGDLVFLALADARRRFGIPSDLLDELVEGTAMDLRGSMQRAVISASAGPVLDLYPTFDELYRYCYLVASVVGLVCIRIFGYEDLRAEKLAEETGIAFQLTNILRDVREDAERGRIYLPVEDMERLGVTPDELARVAVGHRATAGQRELLALEARRAEHYYESAQALLPLISPDSRPALWVLVTIYHELLQRIVRSRFEVFAAKVRVPTWKKFWILGRGLLRVFAYRLGLG